MCEYCHQYPHNCKCPNAPEPKVRGICEQCGEELREDYEYFTDDLGNKFCSKECAMEYYGVKVKSWEYEE